MVMLREENKKKLNYLNKINSIEQLNFLLCHRKYLKYKNNKYINKALFLDYIKSRKVVFIELFFYNKKIIKKQLFLGVCISVTKKGFNSGLILRNVLGKVLVEQKFLIFDKKIFNIRNSKQYFLNYKKSKLYFLKYLPKFFRINKVSLKETFFYKKKKRKRKKK